MIGQEWRIAVGLTLLRFLWVGGALWLAAAVARRLLRGASPRARYAAALATLVSMCAAPAAIIVELRPGPRAAAGALDPLAISPDAAREISGALEALVPLLPIAWALGACLWLLAIAAGLAGTRRLRGRAARLASDHPLARRCRELARELRAPLRAAVATCDRLAGPVVIGLARPVILLPTALLAGLAPRELELVLLHELAHVRRRDNLVVLFQRLAEALLYFHPAVWWVSRWASLERESCCDAAVLALRPDARRYAVTLARLADPTSPALAAGMARRDLPRRIARILGRKERSMSPASRALAALAAGALALALFVDTAAAKSCDDPACTPAGCPAAAQRAYNQGAGSWRAKELPARRSDCTDCHSPAHHLDSYHSAVPSDEPASVHWRGMAVSSSCSDCHASSPAPATRARRSALGAWWSQSSLPSPHGPAAVAPPADVPRFLGSVLDASGRPVLSATLDFPGARGSRAGAGSTAVVTGPDGRFSPLPRATSVRSWLGHADGGVLRRPEGAAPRSAASNVCPHCGHELPAPPPPVRSL